MFVIFLYVSDHFQIRPFKLESLIRNDTLLTAKDLHDNFINLQTDIPQTWKPTLNKVEAIVKKVHNELGINSCKKDKITPAKYVDYLSKSGYQEGFPEIFPEDLAVPKKIKLHFENLSTESEFIVALVPDYVPYLANIYKDSFSCIQGTFEILIMTSICS